MYLLTTLKISKTKQNNQAVLIIPGIKYLYFHSTKKLKTIKQLGISVWNNKLKLIVELGCFQ